jgi:hypothetical protein
MERSLIHKVSDLTDCFASKKSFIDLAQLVLLIVLRRTDFDRESMDAPSILEGWKEIKNLEYSVRMGQHNGGSSSRVF